MDGLQQGECCVRGCRQLLLVSAKRVHGGVGGGVGIYKYIPYPPDLPCAYISRTVVVLYGHPWVRDWCVVHFYTFGERLSIQASGFD